VAELEAKLEEARDGYNSRVAELEKQLHDLWNAVSIIRMSSDYSCETVVEDVFFDVEDAVRRYGA
jgi:hypothetical protein